MRHDIHKYLFTPMSLFFVSHAMAGDNCLQRIAPFDPPFSPGTRIK